MPSHSDKTLDLLGFVGRGVIHDQDCTPYAFAVKAFEKNKQKSLKYRSGISTILDFDCSKALYAHCRSYRIVSSAKPGDDLSSF